jgi:endonuclease YncB( thermonuclease family)
VRRAGLWLGAIGVAAICVGAMWFLAGRDYPDDADPTPMPTITTPIGDIPDRPPDAFPLTVMYVYDGDTIKARVQEPNAIVTTSEPIRIRLIGIDTPEATPTKECWADEARDHLQQLLPIGSTVWAATDRDSWDDYKRRLFYLWTTDDRFVNYALVASGDAEAIRIWPNVAHYPLLQKAQDDAWSTRLGQWGSC